MILAHALAHHVPLAELELHSRVSLFGQQPELRGIQLFDIDRNKRPAPTPALPPLVTSAVGGTVR